MIMDAIQAGWGPNSQILLTRREFKTLSWVRMKFRIVVFHSLNSKFPPFLVLCVKWHEGYWFIGNKSSWLWKTEENMSFFFGEHHLMCKPLANFSHLFRRGIETTQNADHYIKNVIVIKYFWGCVILITQKNFHIRSKITLFLFKRSFNMCLEKESMETS